MSAAIHCYPISDTSAGHLLKTFYILSGTHQSLATSCSLILFYGFFKKRLMICELCKSNNYYSLGENIFENILSYLLAKKKRSTLFYFSASKTAFQMCFRGEIFRRSSNKSTAKYPKRRVVSIKLFQFSPEDLIHDLNHSFSKKPSERLFSYN